MSYIKTKNYKNLLELMNPEVPVNIFIGGSSGIGKSSTILAIAEEQNRKIFRVNLSNATDVDDLVGGLRLKNDSTYFEYGPCVKALLEPGSILLLDEIDVANPGLLMELHPILERKGVLIKKTGEYISPQKGFQVIATGNTKGHGDSTGKYVGTRPLNAAFLDRFGIFYDFVVPTNAEIKKIIGFNLMGKLSENLVNALTRFYLHVYEAYTSSAIQVCLSIRKICDIANVMILLKVEDLNSKTIPVVLNHCFGVYEKEYAESLVFQWNAFYNTYQNTSKPNIQTDDSDIPF